MTHYDVIIIGTGAGGGTLARHLAPSGKPEKRGLLQPTKQCYAGSMTCSPLI